MRVIEKKIMDTIKAGKIGSYRLSCRDSVVITENEVKVYLWSNLIFSKSGDFICFSSCGWQSNTTKSRLNAILSYYNLMISQKNYTWYVESTDGLYYIVDGKRTKRWTFFDNMKINLYSYRVELK